jgi:hypothetical protein
MHVTFLLTAHGSKMNMEEPHSELARTYFSEELVERFMRGNGSKLRVEKT